VGLLRLLSKLKLLLSKPPRPPREPRKLLVDLRQVVPQMLPSKPKRPLNAHLKRPVRPDKPLNRLLKRNVCKYNC
jgi:hypothetical protein